MKTEKNDETVAVIYRSYSRAMSYGKKEHDRKSKRSSERLTGIERREPCAVRVGFTLAMDEMTRATCAGVPRRAIDRLTLGLVKILKVSSLKIILALIREIAAE